MDWKNTFKPSLFNLGLSFLPFLVLSFFLPFIPINQNVICDTGQCQIPSFFTMSQILRTPQLVDSIRFFPLIIEIVFLYFVVSIAVEIFTTIKQDEGFSRQ